MLSFVCPNCQRTVNTPESQSGKQLTCPHCNESIYVPEGNSSNWIILLCVGAGVLVVGCPMLIVVCLAAISVLGTNASQTFTSVGATLNAPPLEQPFKPEKGLDITKDKIFLADLEEIEPKVGWGSFGKKEATGYGGEVTAAGKKYTEALSMHAVTNGDASVKYRLEKKARTFIASVAINDAAETRIATPLVFAVVGDGKVLWESKPIAKPGTTQDCRVDVAGIDMLELRVSCAGSNHYGQSVWLDPHVLPRQTNEGPKEEGK
jgi:hypothetical protein